MTPPYYFMKHSHDIPEGPSGPARSYWDIAGWLGQSLASTTELYAHHHPDFMGNAKKAADRRK